MQTLQPDTKARLWLQTLALSHLSPPAPTDQPHPSRFLPGALLSLSLPPSPRSSNPSLKASLSPPPCRKSLPILGAPETLLKHLQWLILPVIVCVGATGRGGPGREVRLPGEAAESSARWVSLRGSAGPRGHVYTSLLSCVGSSLHPQHPTRDLACGGHSVDVCQMNN